MQLSSDPVHGPRGEVAGQSDGERLAGYMALIQRPLKITGSFRSAAELQALGRYCPLKF